MVSVNVEAFVLQEELLTDLEAQLEEDDDQGTSVSSTTLTDFDNLSNFLSSFAIRKDGTIV